MPVGVQKQSNWPPIMCPKCWAMKFRWNEKMAQCEYCGYVLLNWNKHVIFLGIGRKDS